MIKKILAFVFGILMLLGAVGHIVTPEAYDAMIPTFIPSLAANWLAAIAEAIVSLALIVPKYRKTGALLFVLLMVAFTPIHVWDLLRETPAIGPSPAPQIRLAVQFLLIYAGWRLYKG